MNKILILLALSISFTSCNQSTTTVVDGDYTPSWHYDCRYAYIISLGTYEYFCDWIYYNNDGQIFEQDLAAEVSDQEKMLLNKLSNVYADKFTLSSQSAAKIAKQVIDFSALKDRSADDIADFAQKLYGVNTSEIISAVFESQIGNNTDLDKLIEKASQNLGTNESQTRAIINELHGKVLEENDIQI